MIKVIRDEPLGNWFSKYSGKSFWIRYLHRERGILLFTGNGGDQLYIDDIRQLDGLHPSRFDNGDTITPIVNEKVSYTEGVDFQLVDRPELVLVLNKVTDYDHALIPSLTPVLDQKGITLTCMENGELIGLPTGVDHYRLIVVLDKSTSGYLVEMVDHSGFHMTYVIGEYGDPIGTMIKTILKTSRGEWFDLLRSSFDQLYVPRGRRR